MTRKWLPEGVTEYRDRHGKWRYRFRRAGLPSHSFKNQPGTPEFMVEYQAALKGVKPEPPPRFAAGTVDAVAIALYQTPKWRDMRASSQNTYRRIIDRFREKNGHRMIANITALHIDKKLGTMSDTPAAANNLRKSLSRLFRQAIKMGLMDYNPVDYTDSYKMKGDGFHTWTEADIAAFEAHWPIGTRERLALALLLYTGVRRSDMVLIGPDNRHGDRLKLSHVKNDSETDIPIMPQLEAALAPFEGSTGPYLQTIHGKGFTGDGFGNWFRRKAKEAGLTNHPPHGLRKAMARRLAEAGVTNQQGRAVTGHKSDREFTRYAAKANKAGMADVAMANLAEKLAKDAQK